MEVVRISVYLGTSQGLDMVGSASMILIHLFPGLPVALIESAFGPFDPWMPSWASRMIFLMRS